MLETVDGRCGKGDRHWADVKKGTAELMLASRQTPAGDAVQHVRDETW